MFVFQHAPIAAAALAADGRISHVNPAFEELTALAAITLRGRAFHEVVCPLSEDADDFRLVAQRARPGMVVVRMLGEGPKAGEHLRLTAWHDEDALYALLEPLGAHEEAAASLTELASLVAHEIRNPLAGIGSALEVIGDRLPEGGTEREIIAEIHGRLDRLNDQVDDLLLLVRPISVQKSRCDLSAAIREVAERTSADLSGEPVTLFADPALLQKALSALVKYAAADAAPIALKWETVSDRVRLHISGGRLAALRNAGGRHDGLEVPVARRIVEAHGGRLEFNATSSGVAIRIDLLR